MKYAFDFHQVTEDFPEYFKPLMEDLIKAGNIVSILSGPPREFMIEELTAAGYERDVHYNHLLSVVDWLFFQKDYRAATFEMKQDEKGRWSTDAETWWGSKAKICEEFGIDIMFDDQLEYSKYIKGSRPLFLHVVQEKKNDY